MKEQIKHLLIIGAGASKSINKDFPIGEELIQKIITKGNKHNIQLNNIYYITFSGNATFRENHFSDFTSLLHTNVNTRKPLSIDALMGEIEKREIVVCKGNCEEKNVNTFIKMTKNLITSVLNDLSNSDTILERNYFSDIVQNYIGFSNLENVEIINFNYDLCLEKTIEGILEKQWNLSEEIKGRLNALLEKLKKSHFYGDTEQGIDFIRHKPEDSANFREKFLRAENIYFLGFGFDNLNINNLGLNDLYGTNASRQNVFLTNFGSNAKIQNVVSGIFNVNQFFISNEIRVKKVNKEGKVEEKLLISKTGVSEDKRFKVHIAEMDCFEAVKYNFVF
jgi:hypothetical protein